MASSPTRELPALGAAFRGAFATLPKATPARLRRIDALGSPEQVWELLASGSLSPVELGVEPDLASSWQRIARATEPWALAERWTQLGVEVLDANSNRWPERLVGDPEPPTVMFTRGSIDLDGPCVAIVGTRRCTSYGRRVASRLGAELAERGVAIISGLAMGVDAASQRSALDAGGEVFGVVGSGLDIVYPKRNRALWNDICESGRIWSEYAPGTSPRSWHFPARNRIIAGLADVVVVVESAIKGGSLHTVDAALERDVDVLVVPGPIDSPSSAGTNRLLVQGATPCIGVDDVLVALGLAVRESQATEASHTSPGSVRVSDPTERIVLEALGSESASVAELVLRCGLGLPSVLEAVGRLEVRGVVDNRGGWYQLSERSR